MTAPSQGEVQHPPTLITEPAELAAVCARMATFPRIALDTEFERIRTYFPRLCLVQLASDDEVVCIDPLAIEDLEPLYALLFDQSVTKIVHAGRQDLELFFNLTGKVPAPLFDSQLGARLIGCDEQVGYARMVEDLLGVQLDKAHTRTDWSRRPLSAAQLHYAEDDVRYLIQADRVLTERLEQKDRLAWAIADSEELLDPAFYQTDPGNAWRKVKGGNRLRGRQRQVMKALAHWREEEAIRLDRPRQWLLRDDAIAEIARQQPVTAQALEACTDLPASFLRRSAAAITEVVRQTLAGDAEEDEPAGRPEIDEKLLAKLQKAARKRSAETGIPASVLVTRRELQRLLTGERQLSMLQGWRKNVIGEHLLALLEPQ